jgi:hypothetical protein
MRSSNDIMVIYHQYETEIAEMKVSIEKMRRRKTAIAGLMEDLRYSYFQSLYDEHVVAFQIRDSVALTDEGLQVGKWMVGPKAEVIGYGKLDGGDTEVAVGNGSLVLLIPMKYLTRRR